MNKQLQANFLIVLVALFWGSTYFLTKMAVEELEPFNLTALRFGTAFIITALFFFKRIRNADRTVIKYSIILGSISSYCSFVHDFWGTVYNCFKCWISH